MINLLLATVALVGAEVLTVSPGGLTPQAAVERVRTARRAGDSSAWEIRVRGVNVLTEPLRLTDEDHDLAFVGEEGAALSGGIPVTGWRDVGAGVWEADAPRLADGRTAFFDQLWANGRRAACARFPNEGWFSIAAASQTVARVAAGVTNYLEHVVFSNAVARTLSEVPREDLPYLEAGVICKWSYGLRTLVSSDVAANAVAFETPVRWLWWKTWQPRNAQVAFYNVRSSFDAPGEWFLDMKAGKVRYRPLPGETLAAFSCVVPRPGLSRLVDIRGNWTEGRTARRISFSDLAFLYTSTVGPRNAPEPLVMHQAACGMDGAVTAEGARELAFENCRVAHTANYALRFDSACVSNRIVNCTLEDAGAGGVWMGARDVRGADIARRVLDPVRADAVAFNLISNCTIRVLGRYNPEGTGVALTHCSDTKVVHCDISDVYYTGVSVGFTWGFSGSVAQRNEIAYNRIWDLGKGVMSDMGGVYTLGTSFGTTVHDNVIHDVVSFSYGGWGLYCDEGSEGVVMERNLVWNTTDGGFHQHYGTGCTIRNNIFAFNRMSGAVRMRREVVEGVPCTLHFVNNIVYVSEGPLCGQGVRKVGGIWANNLWWDTSGKAVLDTLDWTGWAASGKESRGRLTDPLFVDAANHDFRLRPESPAFDMGFRPWDFTLAGRKDFK